MLLMFVLLRFIKIFKMSKRFVSKLNKCNIQGKMVIKIDAADVERQHA